jgi:hypothetical protein
MKKHKLCAEEKGRRNFKIKKGTRDEKVRNHCFKQETGWQPAALSGLDAEKKDF